MYSCALVTAGGGGGRGLRVNKSNTVSVEVFLLCQCKFKYSKTKKKVLFSIVFHGTFKKREKSSFILHFKCLYLYGFWRYPFHFIDLSAQNAINQYHFIKATVFCVFNGVLF